MSRKRNGVRARTESEKAPMDDSGATEVGVHTGQEKRRINPKFMDKDEPGPHRLLLRHVAKHHTGIE